MHYVNGNVYDGNWKEDEANGSGTLTYYNGDLYVGNWSNNLRDGEGKFTCNRDKYSYSGSWRNGTKCGIGEITMPDNNRFRGEFLEGRLVGPKLSDGSLVFAFGEESDWVNPESNAF